MAPPLWKFFSPDQAPIFPVWIKGHQGDFANSLADAAATRGMDGWSSPPRPYNVQDVLPVLAAADAARETLPRSFDVNASRAYRYIVALHTSIVKFVRKKLPKRLPQKPWQSLELQEWAEKRDLAWKNRDLGLALYCTKQLVKQSRKEKTAYLLNLTERKGGTDWAGPKAMQPFRSNPIRMKNQQGQVVAADQRTTVLADHYENHQWADDPTPQLPARPPIHPPLEVSTTPFTPPELRRARTKIKTGKAAGEDHISNEFVRLMLTVPALFTLILSMFNDCWVAVVIPGDWWVARIVAIFKNKGLPIELPESYRPIALLQSLYKLYTKLIELRLAPYLHPRICRWQYGFLPKLSVDNAIFVALRMFELADWYANLPVYVLLLDWAKCYDRIRTAPMLDALRRLGVPPHFILVLRNIYENMQFYVGDTLGFSSTRSQRTGLRQGDPLSCLLCIALLTVLMHDAEENWLAEIRTALGDVEFFASEALKRTVGKDYFKYCDDTNLFSSSLRAIRIMFHNVQREGEIYGITVKIRSNYLIRGGPAATLPTPQLKDIHDRLVPVVESEATLGFTLGPKQSTTAILRRKANGMLLSMKQYRLLWRAHIPLRRIVQKYLQLVVSKAISGVHLLTISPKSLQYLEYMHARCLRRILGNSAPWISRISHKDIRKKAHAPSIQYLIRKKQYALLGHILRLPEEHPDRLVLFEPGSALETRIPALALPQAMCKKRRRGRPRTLWVDALLNPLRAQYTSRQIMILANNRSDWFNATVRLCTDE